MSSVSEQDQLHPRDPLYYAPRWLRDAVAPEVDGAQQVVYVHPAWTRYQDRVLLQLVYTIWFPERPPQSEGDILAGRLDGLTWRVTLAPDGRLWIDRLGAGIADTGSGMSAADGERIIRLVAHHVGAEVYARSPRVSGKAKAISTATLKDAAVMK